MSEDVLIDLKEASKMLGMKYHTARKLLYEDNVLGYYDFGRKKLWSKNQILNFKETHFVKPITY